jgi:hypothetical protein
MRSSRYLQVVGRVALNTRWAILSEILKRPKNDKPYLLAPIGCLANGANLLNITKKRFEEIAEVIE